MVLAKLYTGSLGKAGSGVKPATINEAESQLIVRGGLPTFAVATPTEGGATTCILGAERIGVPQGMFWIGFTTEKPPYELPEEVRTGLLMLGEHEETFVAHTDTWSEERYIEHWKLALGRVLDGRSSALVTDMRTPAQSSHLVWWPVWKADNKLVFHNQLLFFAKHNVEGEKIDIERLYELVGTHSSLNGEGLPVSEWQVAVEDVEKFLESDTHRPIVSPSQRSKGLN